MSNLFAKTSEKIHNAINNDKSIIRQAFLARGHVCKKIGTFYFQDYAKKYESSENFYGANYRCIQDDMCLHIALEEGVRP